MLTLHSAHSSTSRSNIVAAHNHLHLFQYVHFLQLSFHLYNNNLKSELLHYITLHYIPLILSIEGP
jgi:hypothetical protein